MKLKYPFEGTFRISQKFRENPEIYKKFGLAIFLVWLCKASNKIGSILENNVVYRFLDNCDKRNIFQTKRKSFDVKWYGNFGKEFVSCLYHYSDIEKFFHFRQYGELAVHLSHHILRIYDHLFQELYNNFHRTLNYSFSLCRKSFSWLYILGITMLVFFLRFLHELYQDILPATIFYWRLSFLGFSGSILLTKPFYQTYSCSLSRRNGLVNTIMEKEQT